ncbi:FRIGIDA-like protein 3 [Euphorbia lathyris]|uniref:FRIGIDA-like protein 3 n=1 Tax=Euphorbia lathyris TaxID=212925 RepID=UPI003313AFA1
MNNSEQGVEDLTASSLIEQLGRALHDLQNQKDGSEDRVQWIEIEQHFKNLDSTMKRNFEELRAREKEYMEKEAETSALLAKREAAVVAKEQDFLDRVQELKDAAVAIISEARATHQPIVLECVDVGDNKDNKVSSSLGETNSTEEESPHKLAESVVVEIKPRPELTQFCEQMDARGLLSFIMENQKNLYTICMELSVALESANEPARLVLDSLEAFYPPVETTLPKDKKDAALQGMRKSCIVFMEAMAAYLARLDSGADHLLNPEIKQQAKAIADEWKPKLAIAGIDATNGNSLEAEAFLHLLSTFRIASEFDEEELCKLVVVVSRRRQAPELCRSLGLTHKMPGVIESMLNSGKQIEAVPFIHDFQLTDRFPLVPMLKAYLKEYRRNFQGKGGNAQVDVNAQELAALKNVVRCVEEYKLEADYPLDPLQKRLAQLVKCKSDKKKSGDSGRHHQSKKPRVNGGYRGFRGGGTSHGGAGGRQVPPVYAERTAYTGMQERYSHPAPNPYDYQIPSQSAYGQPATTDQRQYYYAQDDRVITAGSYDATPNYGTYMGPGMRSNQPYM